MYNLLDVNTGMKLSGLFHMYTTGPGSLFNYGNTGPNKYTATANPMFFYGDHYDMPQYQLFQHDQVDAADPWSMFWYDPMVYGAFWDGLALDHFFDNSSDQWASMQSSWTDKNALFVAMKAGTLQGHQTHNDQIVVISWLMPWEPIGLGNLVMVIMSLRATSVATHRIATGGYTIASGRKVRTQFLLAGTTKTCWLRRL